MADAWVEFPGADLTEIRGLSEATSSVLTTFALAMKAAGTALDGVSAFLQEDTNAIRATINAATAVLEAVIYDLLQNNVAMGVHFNMEWNPEWTYEDFETDAELPWTGRGLESWLLDIAASTLDESDPFRPLTDADTSVGGFILVLGTDTASELSDLKTLFEVFRDYSDFAEAFEEGDSVMAKATEFDKSMYAKMGAAWWESSFIREAVTDTGDARTKVVEQSGLADAGEGYVPQRGAYPKWASVPVAALLPDVKEFIDLLHQLRDNLSMGASTGDSLAQLAEILSRRADLLEEMAQKLESIIAALDATFNLFANARMIWLTSETGGMGNFVNRAATATDVPDYGSDGIVAGVVAVATMDDPLNHLQSFWEFLGLQVETIAGSTTTKQQNLSDTFDSLYP